MENLVGLLIKKTGLSNQVVDNIISLIQEGNTIPFIARYRKEMTDEATDTQLRDFEEIYTYQKKLLEKKEDIIRLLTEKEVITDELRASIQAASTLSQLEDIYRPFKDKKNTRATKAIAKGLQPLADLLLACELSTVEFENLSTSYIKDTGDEKTSVTSAQEAIQGAMDIIAEIIADNPEFRAEIKATQDRTIILESTASKKFEEHSVYETYKNYRKPISQMPSYAYLAITRAESEKQLRVKLHFNESDSIAIGKKIFVPSHASDLKEILHEVILDGIKRLLHPSLEREYRSNKKSQSDREAIDIFGKNVKELLLSSPVKQKVIMGFDPAYRTGCKIAIIDATGKYIDSTVVYPTEPQKKIVETKKVLLKLIADHNVGLICIGNGTASRESEKFIAELIKEESLDTKYLVVSEAGASVYSASKLANEEYPDLDVTIRGAINIAQRVQDPLSTYVKIDPKSLGVGQYQHDVDQKLLKEKLDNHIQDAVNRVGIDINTASRALLQHISGLSNTMAKNVITFRDANGSFNNRKQIKKVTGIGPKAYEQCAGFLRINAAKELLDSTGIHPESYKVTYEILEKEFNLSKKTLKLPFVVPIDIDIENLAHTYKIGSATLQDIIDELANPGLDPRTAFDEKGFKSDILTLEDLKKGVQLNGVVRNIVDFGAFIDIGLKNDGLLHKSQLGKQVQNVFDVLSIGQQIDVIVLEVDLERKRVSLSLKSDIVSKRPQIKKKVKIKKSIPEPASSITGNIVFS